MIEIILCKTSDGDLIKTIESLGVEIWQEYYVPIIGKEQVDYMLNKFQSQEAILRQIKEGYYYYLIKENEAYTGYIALLSKDTELFLSKIYIKSANRGYGIGKKALQFVEKVAKEQKLPKITLTVNKYNINSINIYQKFSFKITKSVITDIDSGYVMDDYIMEKPLL